MWGHETWGDQQVFVDGAMRFFGSEEWTYLDINSPQLLNRGFPSGICLAKALRLLTQLPFLQLFSPTEHEFADTRITFVAILLAQQDGKRCMFRLERFKFGSGQLCLGLRIITKKRV